MLNKIVALVKGPMDLDEWRGDRAAAAWQFTLPWDYSTERRVLEATGV
jgi:hypothetical protein